MLRYSRIAVGGFVMVLVGVVYAGTIKVKHICAVGLGLTENPHAGGRVMVDFDPELNGGTNEIAVRIRCFLPNTTYGIKMISGEGAEFSVPDAITTNDHGKGKVLLDPGQSGTADYSFPPVEVIIYRWDGDPDMIGEISETEIRASGISGVHCRDTDDDEDDNCGSDD